MSATKEIYADMFGLTFSKLTVVGLLAIQDPGAKPCKLEWVCKCECGNILSPTATNLRGGFSESCGICVKSGPNNHNWIEDRNLIKYKRHELFVISWRNAIFARDNYTCAACKERGKELHAHHLYSWAAFPLKRIFLDNGITLCQECHKEFHTWNGGPRFASTKKLYREWIEKVVKKHSSLIM